MASDESSNPPSKEEYVKLLVDTIHQAGEERSIHYDEEKFRLLVEGGRQHSLNLGNLYGEYCQATPKERENMLRRTAKSWLDVATDLPDSLEEARTDLLPIVRTRSYLQAPSIEAQMQGKEPPGWPHQVLGDHLAVGVVYDLPNSMATINQEKLDEWGITLYEALEIALDNLRHLECQVAASESPRLYVVSSGDYYDASRLIHLDFVRQLEVEGDHVAMVPNRNQLIVTGSDDEVGLAMVAELAEKTLQDPRPLSGIAFRLVGEDWQAWLPPRLHPSWSAFKSLLLQTMGQEYSDQKELLDEFQEKAGVDIFVANFSGAEDDQGEVFSYCVWAKGADSLLPQTDKVAFIDKDAQPQIADWEKVVEVCGHLMKPKDWYPERWFVEEYPTPEELQKMGAVPL